MWYFRHTDELYHHGILGQKWGVRRYQNRDGTLTAEGRKRYHSDKKTVFISGSSKTEFKDSEYYRKKLPKPIRKKISEYAKSGYDVVVGDAPGIDRQVQRYLKKIGTKNVTVFSPGKKNRYIADKIWNVKLIDAPEFEEGSKEWLAKKDIYMTKISDMGLAVVLDKGSAATRNNVRRLLDQNKDVDVFVLSRESKRKDYMVDKKDINRVIDEH